MSWFVATAGAAGEFDELGAFVVVLAEASGRDGARLEIQRGLTLDSRDERLGSDAYCLCTETGTHYGGVQSWRIDNGQLCISLSETAAAALRVTRELTIELRLNAEAVELVTAGVERALGRPRSV